MEDVAKLARTELWQGQAPIGSREPEARVEALRANRNAETFLNGPVGRVPTGSCSAAPRAAVVLADAAHRKAKKRCYLEAGRRLRM